MKYILIFITIFSSQVFTQEKYFIYFKDKGTEVSQTLNKSNLEYVEAVKSLSPKAIERRIKNIGEEFITYDDLPINKNYIAELESLNIKIIRKLNWFNSVSADLTSDQIEIIKNLPYIKSIEPVKKLYFQNDPLLNPDPQLNKELDITYNYGLSLNQMNLSDVPIVHSKNINGNEVIIGILDTGFDWKLHNSLKDRNVIAEYDFIFDDSITANQPEDVFWQDSHGTYVFSVIAGFADSILIGPAFNSSFILAKTEKEGSETHIEEDNYAASLIWMESLGVDITTSSLGYNIFDDGYAYSYSEMNGNTTIVTRALELAFERGVSTFTSAGNEGDDPWFYILAPADGFNVISVGAVTENRNVAGFSSRGPTSDGRIKPEVVAMGVNIFGARAGTEDLYTYKSGTSAAAPIASGVAALLLSAHPHLKNTQMRNIILESSSNSSNPNNQIGYGIISAKNAIEFPNLEFKNVSYILHKSFLEDAIDTQSVTIIFNYGEDYLEPFILTKENNYDYILQIPQQNNGTIIQISFEYTDSLGDRIRVPESGNYSFSYGSDIIAYNMSVNSPAGNYEVSDFYPNPFIPDKHKSVSFNYHTNGNEKLKVVIIDGAGQQVSEYISTTSSNPGFYYFYWDGYSDRGYLCASGVYYALIQIGGKEYGKKLVLLK